MGQTNPDDRQNQTKEHREFLEKLSQFRDRLLRSYPSIVYARLVEDHASDKLSLVIDTGRWKPKREQHEIVVGDVYDRELLRYLRDYLNLVIDKKMTPEGDGQPRNVGEDFQNEFSELGQFWRSAFFRSASDRYKGHQMPG
jgi:hypothetical protein